ncbi:MAG: hypothetical protein ACKOPM_17295 [Novosphingobium sp.]
MSLEEEPEPRFGGFYGEPLRVLLINAPLALFLVSAEYTSWLFQERPRQPDPVNGFVQLMDHKGIRVFATPGEAWASQWLSNLFWIALALSVGLLWLRTFRRPDTPVFRLPEEGVPRPAEFVATLIGMAGIAYGILVREF